MKERIITPSISLNDMLIKEFSSLFHRMGVSKTHTDLGKS
jgi:hypothetical protein